MSTLKYQAGTFSNLQPFATLAEAKKYCKNLKKETTQEVRIIVCKTNKNIIL